MGNFVIKKLNYKSSDEHWTLVLKKGIKPEKISYSNSRKNQVTFNNGKIATGTCINCSKKPCIYYDQEEINVNIIDGLPYNNDNRVCPTNAIIDNKNIGISINTNQCIGCSICIRRCPTGGISFTDDGTFVDVVNATNDNFNVLNYKIKNQSDNTFKSFENAKKVSHINKININSSTYFRKKYLEFSSIQSDLELIMVRNFLINIGILNKVSTRGNNDIRMDFVGSINGKIIPGEIELNGNDILGLPRRILDDIAVLNSRYKIDKVDIIPIIIIFLFPRKRSDFYEVLSDIEKITGYKIRTLPIHFLKLMTLYGLKLNEQNLNDNFIINLDNQDFSNYTKTIIPGIEVVDDNFGTELYSFCK